MKTVKNISFFTEHDLYPLVIRPFYHGLHVHKGTRGLCYTNENNVLEYGDMYIGRIPEKPVPDIRGIIQCDSMTPQQLWALRNKDVREYVRVLFGETKLMVYKIRESTIETMMTDFNKLQETCQNIATPPFHIVINKGDLFVVTSDYVNAGVTSFCAIDLNNKKYRCFLT